MSENSQGKDSLQSETKPRISNDALSHRIQETAFAFNTLSVYPNLRPQLDEAASTYEPVARAIVEEVLSGKRAPEDLIRYMAQERAVSSLSGKVDFLSMEYKRDDFERILAQRLESIDSANETVLLRFYDLTNFKNVNDLMGQEGGNRVLEAAAKKFREKLNPEVIGGRIGDEFLYFEVLPHEEAQQLLADEARRIPTPEPLTTVSTREGPITVYTHTGIAVYDPSVDTRRQETDERGTKQIVTPAQSLINRANAATDRAKSESKRNTQEPLLTQK